MIEVHAVRHREEAMIAPVAAFLARTFAHDPWVGYLVPAPLRPEPNRMRLVACMFEPMVRAGLCFGKVLVTSPKLVGAVVAMSPSRTHLSKEEMQRVGFDDLDAQVGEAIASRFRRHDAQMQLLHDRDVSVRHWYIALLGVAETARRRGVGSTLMRQALRYADKDRVPTYLQTSNVENVDFYHTLGFVVVRHGTAPVGNVPFWTMARRVAG